LTEIANPSKEEALMFNWLKPKPAKPTLLDLRENLFADQSFEKTFALVKDLPATSELAPIKTACQLFKNGNRAGAVTELNKVVAITGVDSRTYLQVWYLLRSLGQMPPTDIAKKIRGVILEVHLDQGLDLLAAYDDHTAKYYNYSGAGVIWNNPPMEADINTQIDKLLEVGQAIVNNIGTWDKPRLPIPQKGSVRINLLTYDGYYFGQGEYNVLNQDPMGGAAIAAGYNLMNALTRLQLSLSAKR
jgi:hypothetical protein